MKKNVKKVNSSEQTFKAGEVMSMLESMNDGIKIIAETQEDIVKRLGGLEDSLEIIKSDVTEIKFELKRKVSYDEFEKLEKRVIRLEKLGFAT